MDGLDIEEIHFSNLENSFTIGAEYYGKNYVHTADIVKRMNHKTLHEISKRITDGDHGSSDYQDNGVLYLLSESVQEGYIDISKCRFITTQKNEELKRSELHPGDVVVTKTGVYFGKSAVIPNDISKANMIAHVGKIELKKGYNPYFVSTFLNSKYGYSQLRRRGIKATRPEIKLVEFPGIMVPIFSETFEQKIESVILLANQILSCSLESMSQCESVLTKEIGVDIETIDSTNYSVQPFRMSYCNSGRLDAEYYQPKYEQIEKELSTNETIASLCNLFDSTFSPEKESDYKYIELANVSNGGVISGVVTSKGKDLPTRARRLVKKGQVIISSVEGSLDSCALITEEYDNALCSTGFYVIDSDRINSETLLVLFKSEAIQALLKQRCSGTILTAISKDELLNIPLPVIDDNIQKEIAAKVQESFALRKKSKDLLEYAKQAVEMAIEQGEETAIEWLKSKGI